MPVALLTTFVANKKEPLAELLERIHAAFLTAGLDEPSILFTLSDSPVPGGVSAVDRLIKKYPEFSRFAGQSALAPNTPPIRQVSNRRWRRSSRSWIARSCRRLKPRPALRRNGSHRKAKPCRRLMRYNTLAGAVIGIGGPHDHHAARCRWPTDWCNDASPQAAVDR
jgi:hypothetical protein